MSIYLKSQEVKPDNQGSKPLAYDGYHQIALSKTYIPINSLVSGWQESPILLLSNVEHQQFFFHDCPHYFIWLCVFVYLLHKSSLCCNVSLLVF